MIRIQDFLGVARTVRGIARSRLGEMLGREGSTVGPVIAMKDELRPMTTSQSEMQGVDGQSLHTKLGPAKADVLNHAQLLSHKDKHSATNNSTLLEGLATTQVRTYSSQKVPRTSAVPDVGRTARDQETTDISKPKEVLQSSDNQPNEQIPKHPSAAIDDQTPLTEGRDQDQFYQQGSKIPTSEDTKVCELVVSQSD